MHALKRTSCYKFASKLQQGCCCKLFQVVVTSLEQVVITVLQGNDANSFATVTTGCLHSS